MWKMRRRACSLPLLDNSAQFLERYVDNYTHAICQSSLVCSNLPNTSTVIERYRLPTKGALPCNTRPCHIIAWKTEGH